MQVKKERLRARILSESKREFQRAGFSGATMRDIARRSGIATGNIYTYFRSKEDLFLEIIRPTIDAIHAAVVSLRDNRIDFAFNQGDHVSLTRAADQIAEFIDVNRQDLSLILFKSTGSRIENFRESFIQQLTDVMGEKLDRQRDPHHGEARSHSRFFFHTLCSMAANIVSEVVMHDIPLDTMKDYFRELAGFFAPHDHRVVQGYEDGGRQRTS